MLYTVGCSFTYAQQCGWPNILADKINFTLENKGHPGAGNAYIGNALILNPAFARKKPDLVVVMWSGLTRKDLSVDHTDTQIMSALDGYGYIRWTGHETSYILSGGGQIGSWHGHPATKEIFAPLYKFSNERTMAQDTLVQIINTQNYLKQNNIPYLMSSYVNYWGNDKKVADLDYGIGQFKDLRYLVDKIDFSRWVFANENKDCIYELAKMNSDLEEDMFHPGFDTHARWADLIIKKLNEDNYITTEKK
jgi:hypothetical protein